MILTSQQRKSLERCLARTQALTEKGDYLQQIGAAAPVYTERVDQLNTRRRYLENLANVAIVADSSTRS
jgi:predicted Zn-dependent protease